MTWISYFYVRLTKSKIWMVTSSVTYFSYSKFIWNGCCPTHTKFPTPYITNLVCGGHSCQAIFVVLSMVYNKLHISSYIWNMINWLLNLKWNLSVSLKFIAVFSISTFYSTCEWWWSLHDQFFVVYRTHIFFLWLLIPRMQDDF